jgi:hypothetical protein
MSLKNFVPTDGTLGQNLGSKAKRWNKGYITKLVDLDPDNTENEITISVVDIASKEEMSEELEALEESIEAEESARITAVSGEASARATDISNEVTARNTAISTAVSAEATARDNAIAAAIDDLGDLEGLGLFAVDAQGDVALV